jgi:dihydrodiol dehydrogenase / D-xylose 1-dehydrogenase (NADP)
MIATEHAVYNLIGSGAIGELKFIQATLAQSITNLSVTTVAGWISAFQPAAPKSVVAAQGQLAGGATVELEDEHGRCPVCSILWHKDSTAESIAFIGSTGRIVLDSEGLTLVTNESPDLYPGAYQGLYIPVVKEVLPAEKMVACSPKELTQDELRVAAEVLASIASALDAPQPQQPPPFLAGQAPDIKTEAVETVTSLSTPLDIQMGLTSGKDASHPLRWGILTAGRICKDFVQAIKIAVSRGCGATVTAVAARKLHDAEAFVKELELSDECSVYDSYQQLCADPNVDIVYVGTITALHSKLTLLAIEGNKHVVCEKPLASNTEEARVMFAAADAAGVLLHEGMWTRFFPATEHARAAIQRGDIGVVTTLSSTFPDRCYPVQAAPMVFGTRSIPTVVAAGNASGGSGGSATLVYDGSSGAGAGGSACDSSAAGGVAMVSMPTFTESQFDESFVVRGTGGTIVIEAPAHCPTKVTINGETVEYPLPAYSFKGGYPQCNQHGFFYQIEAVHRILANDLRECPQHTRADSLAVVYIIDQIREQAGGTVHC